MFSFCLCDTAFVCVLQLLIVCSSFFVTVFVGVTAFVWSHLLFVLHLLFGYTFCLCYSFEFVLEILFKFYGTHTKTRNQS